MVKIQRFKVIKMACFLGLFGAFMGIVFGIIISLLTLFVPVLATYAIWMYLVGIPIGYGVMMFIISLIFVPLVNLTLRIIKGLDLDLDLTESTSAGPLTTGANGKKEIKPVIKYPVKSAKDSSPLSQMTNSKTTAQNPVPKTPIRPAI